MPVVIGVFMQCEQCGREEHCNKWERQTIDPGYVDVSVAIEWFLSRGWTTGHKNYFCPDCNYKMHGYTDGKLGRRANG